ncbi:MAG: hypothetical protein H7330_03645 [Hymenobacteraceae bacterium]|nr:hypothetical protein [Hymenobacteraceae bacterium]
MSICTRFGFMLGWFLLPVLGSAQVIKPELIMTESGGTLVFNTAESFFAVDVAGDKLLPAPNTDGFFQVDARLIRLVNTPQRELARDIGQRVLMPKELLQMQFRHDLDEEQFNLQRPITTTKQEYITTPKGRLVLHWWLELPGSSDRSVTQRHYMSTICDRQVLTASAPLLPNDTQEELRSYLIKVMLSVRESDDPINVTEYAKELQSDK